MPDASGRFAGQGWSRKKEAAWERVFGDAATQRCCGSCIYGARTCAEFGCVSLEGVPHEPPHEDLDECADRDEAAGWGR